MNTPVNFEISKDLLKEKKLGIIVIQNHCRSSNVVV
jgi:hypothetical protein